MEAGANALRTYVPPPLWLLDLAQRCGLNVMVGLAWEQHVAFLDDPELTRGIVARIGRQVRECEAHPAILCYALGNEIPAPIVRWHGKEKVERFLERLYWEAKAADPDGLFTYVNYPSTEYLELPFLDLAAFNVFLEEEGSLRVLSGAAAEPLRRPAAADHRGRHRQSPQRRGASRPRRSTGRSGTPSRPAPPGSSSSPGPTSGTGAGTTSSTGTSGWSTASGSRRPRSRRSEGLRRRALRAGGPVAASLGGRLHPQRSEDAFGVPRAGAPAHLPGLRADRRRRRLQRRLGARSPARTARTWCTTSTAGSAQPATPESPGRRARSSPSSTTTPIPTPTGCTTWPRRCAQNGHGGIGGPNIPPGRRPDRRVRGGGARAARSTS